MAYEFARYEKQGRIAVVTINRPERMNALHPPANLELHEIWNDFERDPEVWIGILTGAGDKAFSAGNDLRYTAEHGMNMVRSAETGFGGITSRTTCWKPIIAAVNGFALGGGFEMALACDIIVAAEHARVGLPEVRVGLMAGAGGVHRLPRHDPAEDRHGAHPDRPPHDRAGRAPVGHRQRGGAGRGADARGHALGERDPGRRAALRAREQAGGADGPRPAPRGRARDELHRGRPHAPLRRLPWKVRVPSPRSASPTGKPADPRGLPARWCRCPHLARSSEGRRRVRTNRADGYAHVDRPRRANTSQRSAASDAWGGNA